MPTSPSMVWFWMENLLVGRLSTMRSSPRGTDTCSPPLRSPQPRVSRSRIRLLRTAAFRPLATVGLPLATALRDILSSTTLRIAGLDHAACLLVPSRSVRPLLGVHVDVAPDLLAR